MGSQKIHSEFKVWNNAENLIEFYKFKISHTFAILYWSIGILLTVVISVMIAQSTKIISYTGIWIWIGLLTFFTFSLILSIFLINLVHKKSSNDLEYLYRKLDGQIS